MSAPLISDVLIPNTEFGEDGCQWEYQYLEAWSTNMTKKYTILWVKIYKLTWHLARASIIKSKSKLILIMKWSEGFLFVGHGKPASAKN